jgi:hypothetical protein
MDSKQNLSVAALGQEQLKWFYDKYRDIIRANTQNQDAMHFQLACSYKNQAIFTSVQHELPGKDSTAVAALFAKAVNEYSKVSKAFLETDVKVKGISITEDLIVPRKFTFIYPDFKPEFHPFEPRSFGYYYYTDEFLKYILDQQLFDSFYPTNKELSYFTKWLSDLNTAELNMTAWEVVPPRYAVLQRVENEIGKRKDVASLDMNWLYLYLGQMASQSGNKAAMLKYYDQIQFEKIFNLLRSKEFGGLARDQSFRLLAEALRAFAENNKPDQARKLTAMFKNAVNRSSLYAYAASEVLKQDAKSEVGKQLLDSAKAELKRVENTSGGQPNRVKMAYALTLQSPDKNSAEAFGLIKNLNQKFFAIQHITRSFSFYGKLYDARLNIPPNISSTDQAAFLTMILFGYNEGTRIAGEAWKEYLLNAPTNLYSHILYIDENS